MLFRSEKIKNNIEIYKNREGLCILGYLLALLSYNYENENRFTAVLLKKIEDFQNENREKEMLTGISAEIFEYLSKEV